MAAPKKPAPPPLTSSPYPFAAAPDIIRAHQKDAYFQGVLTNQIGDVHRRLRGARSAHTWATETRTAADTLYLALTTLLGNRTLGEEYCDLVQVEEPHSHFPGIRNDDEDSNGGEGGPRLPSLARRAGYIISSVLLPYFVGRLLPGVRAALRKRLQARLAVLAARQQQQQQQQHQQQQQQQQAGGGKLKKANTFEYRVQRYLLNHLSSITSGAHLHAATLAVFYFTGAYYSLSKRVFGLRYVFTRRLDSESQGGRVGYEVLGVLLAVQMVVRGYLHMREQISAHAAEDQEQEIRERAFASGVVLDVSLDHNSYTSNNELLGGASARGDGNGNQRSLVEIGASMHTPVPKGGQARYDLAEAAVMSWIKGQQQRKCTLCLEEMKDPAATQCGHVFCWACIGDWVREKPECPLCRREAMMQHILPLRVAASGGEWI
ncbi:Pex12 amino terminal region-domain-containing protein [Podospora didyma]|uniref:RING-type E3 ubiquitin transferase n=1 Tax=Podospora didyma TaxID=330526 RepID=A0AAE0P6N9_9PEZI|nr:Pex12 amino terminal region-domain-containing protein [Podospora didyma]